MSLTGNITILFQDKEKQLPLFPRTKIKAISDDDGNALTKILADMDTKWAGCWIDFTDEDGNSTNEPYLHYAVDENGNPVYKPEISLAEDGEF